MGSKRNNKANVSQEGANAAELSTTKAEVKDSVKKSADAPVVKMMAFEHFVKEGSMTILDTVYEIKDYVVLIRPEHAEFALHHGLKPKK